MNIHTHSVLVIEDCLEMHEIYRAVFAESESVNFELVFAATGREGLDVVNRGGFDCILLDYNLPDVDGLSFLRKLRVDLKNPVPVIMVTGHGHARVAVNALKAGATDYLLKDDITIHTLQNAITGAIRRRRDDVILGEARDVLIVKQQNVIDRQKRQLQAFEIEMMSVDEGHEIH